MTGRTCPQDDNCISDVTGQTFVRLAQENSYEHCLDSPWSPCSQCCYTLVRYNEGEWMLVFVREPIRQPGLISHGHPRGCPLVLNVKKLWEKGFVFFFFQLLFWNPGLQYRQVSVSSHPRIWFFTLMIQPLIYFLVCKFLKMVMGDWHLWANVLFHGCVLC
jgi:hypothetical protein